MKKTPYVWMPGMVGIEHYELDDDLPAHSMMRPTHRRCSSICCPYCHSIYHAGGAKWLLKCETASLPDHYWEQTLTCASCDRPFVVRLNLVPQYSTYKCDDDNEKPVRFKGSSPEEVSLDLTDPATIGCLLVQVSHKARLEREAAIRKAQDAPLKWEIFKVSPDPSEWEMYPVKEPMPVNDILRQVLREIAINGFRQSLRIGGLLLRALEAAE